MEKVIIIGGVAGGASAATRLRRLRDDIEITIIERGEYVSFANCGLPYYIGDIIKNKSSLELVTPEIFFNRFGIDVKIKHDALAVNRDKKEITVRIINEDREITMEYDYLVLSPGAAPIVPPLGDERELPLFTLRTIPDSERIKKHVDDGNVRHAAIIGGGFIGIEMAENLKEKGIDVTIIEMLNQVMAPLDFEMAQYIHRELILKSIDLVLEDPVDSCKIDNDRACVNLKSGRKIPTDMIILAIGVKPENRLAVEADIEVGPRGHIITDENMRTSDPSIYAVGDAVQVKHYITGKDIAIPLAGPANKQGRIAADNIAGKESMYRGILGSAVVKVFGLTVAAVGLSEKALKGTGIDYEKVYVHPNNHAGYYPGAQAITLKVIFEKAGGKVLGAQAVGGPGTEKRIDVLSTVIKYQGTIFDLEELELTYAPPYSSAKDPVNMAGFVGSNVLKGDMNIWHWHDLDKINKDNVFILDVRTRKEFEGGALENAVNITDMELRKRIDEIPMDRDIYLYCAVGYRGYLASRLLMQKGYKNVFNLTGGYSLLNTARSSIENFKAQRK